MLKRWPELPGWTWDTWTGRWKNENFRMSEPRPIVSREELFPDFKSKPATFLKYHRSLIGKLDDKAAAEFSELSDFLKKVIAKKMPWIEFEDRVTDWYLNNSEK